MSGKTSFTGGSDAQRILNQREYGALRHRIASHKRNALRPPPMTVVLRRDLKIACFLNYNKLLARSASSERSPFSRLMCA